jgi:SAM-dependent methyltransferase
VSDETNRLLDTAAIFRYHQACIRAYGNDGPAALGWTQPAGQQARFAALAGIGNLAHCSVLDAGCGHADLYPFLRARYPGVQYCGIEQVPELLAVAEARHGHAADVVLGRGDFRRAPLPPADYVLASGALSYRHHDPHFVYHAIEKLFAACRLGLGFNLLSREPVPGGLLVAYEPATIRQFCAGLADKVVLVEGYWAGDFTVFA